jgi:four helix bundle protein
VDADIAALEAKLAKARQVKQGMMQELLTGKTRLVESGEWRVESGKGRVERGGGWMSKGPLYGKSFAFALRVVKLAKYLQGEKKEFVLSKQVLRSGTAIGALVREAEHAESKADFAHKMNIALKEANETQYWLELLHQSEFIDRQSFDSIHRDAEELIRLLVAIVKTSKKSLRRD